MKSAGTAPYGDSARPRYENGSVHVVDYPFARETYNGFDDEGPFTTITWRPGTRFEWCSPEDTEAICDGMGKVEYTVVSSHKPGRYPMRIFYTRQWVSPDGHRFGRNNLHIATQDKFTRLLKGYSHEFRLASSEETAEHEAQLKDKAA